MAGHLLRRPLLITYGVECPELVEGPVYIMTWLFYIIECDDDSYYVGYSKDAQHRFDLHKLGSGAMHTLKYKPLRILYTESY